MHKAETIRCHRASQRLTLLFVLTLGFVSANKAHASKKPRAPLLLKMMSVAPNVHTPDSLTQLRVVTLRSPQRRGVWKLEDHYFESDGKKSPAFLEAKKAMQTLMKRAYQESGHSDEIISKALEIEENLELERTHYFLGRDAQSDTPKVLLRYFDGSESFDPLPGTNAHLSQVSGRKPLPLERKYDFLQFPEKHLIEIGRYAKSRDVIDPLPTFAQLVSQVWEQHLGKNYELPEDLTVYASCLPGKQLELYTSRPGKTLVLSGDLKLQTT